MILDLKRFIEREEPFWDELEKLLEAHDRDVTQRLTLRQIQRLHYLVVRVGAALSRVETFGSGAISKERLENLVARGYAMLHSRERTKESGGWKDYFTQKIPQAMRARINYFWVSLLITLVGAALGAGLIAADVKSREVIFPFDHLLSGPEERVREEEKRTKDHPIDQHRASFAGMLMTHNIQVSLLALGMGMLCGVGSVILLFYNGVILGAVCFDYIHAGQGVFLAGWLLPHGVIEIPAILIGGQAGLMLGHAVIGNGSGLSFRYRMNAILSDVLCLAALLGVMLVWAGIVEAFFSQYHEPRLPYAIKIGFGIAEGIALVAYLTLAGRGKRERSS